MPVVLKAYDSQGALIATMLEGMKSAGTHQLTWNAARLPAGVYLLKLEAGGFSAVQKAVVVK
jgi:flagellar hook assembly protein FlgD